MKEILQLKCLLKNIDIKLSAVTDTSGVRYQILSIVTTSDQILLRYVSETDDVILKKIDWFNENGKIIQDIGFDPSGTWLIALCLDNTLHIVPALSICDKSITFAKTFAPNEISSFIIPFIGPHECSNPQKCPNFQFDFSSDPMILEKTLKRTAIKRGVSSTQVQDYNNKKDQFSTSKVDELITSNSIYNTLYCDQKPNSSTLSKSSSFNRELSADGIDKIVSSTSSTPCESGSVSAMGTSTISYASSGSVAICPIPTAVLWWKTHQDEHRGILGYSDGFIVIVSLANNCPFVGNTVVEKGCIEKLMICRDSSLDIVTLLINTTSKEQYKMLLEQKSTSYVFPTESRSILEPITQRVQRTDSDSEWEVVSSISTDALEKTSETQDSEPSSTTDEAMSKLFPAAKARLLSLRDLGAKKIGNLKLKLAESRLKKEKAKLDQVPFTILNSSTVVPELLTSPSGPYFIVQKSQDKNLMSALHAYSDTLSIHNIEIMMIPSSLYKLPPHARNVLLTDSVLYVHQLATSVPHTVTASTPVNQISETSSCVATVGLLSTDGVNGNTGTDENTPTTQSSQDDNNNNNNTNNYSVSSDHENVISVVSCHLASTKIGDDCEFNERAILGTFKFPSNERILSLHRMITFNKISENEVADKNQSQEGADTKSTYSKYLNSHSKIAQKFDESDRKVLKNEFPQISFEKCLIVTQNGVYCVQLKELPHIIFLNLASASFWSLCDDFCKTFNLNMSDCVEFAGDVLLKKKKVEQALVTYNIARVPPIKTALKLAMFNETSALRQISAMSLKVSFILESKHPMSPLIYELLKTVDDRHETSDVIKGALRDRYSLKLENAGKIISDFLYSSDENNLEMNMSNSAQFHLANLLFLTLCERCVKDKNMMPLWNFICINNKYHTSLSSIILSQSGLYSTAILLAMHRGACLDVFSCLVSVADHVMDISNEMKVFAFNLSEEMFMETIVYLPNYALDYFEMIRSNLDKFDEAVLVRLMKQLNPFDPIYRPILFKVKNQNIIKELENRFLEFCKTLIETYILILIKLQRLQNHKESFLNALNVFRVTSEERQNYVKLINFSPLSAGFSHAGCVADNSCFIWGNSGVNCALSKNILQNDASENDVAPARVEFFRDINLDVYSVHCGRSHTLFLTNNGLYAIGSNQLGQLGIDRKMNVALQPMLIRALDNKIITQICAGQHHNAVVADGQLYTWGWNVYGQLGHGDIRTVREPKLVEFFRNMKIKQISLGQAHTMVLVYERHGDLSTSLYMFGSNHFGQLGITLEGEYTSSIPLRLNSIDENIRLIHTQYFVSFAVTESNRLWTWGLSPPELRIINQTKKRAKANQKLKESMQEPPPPPPPEHNASVAKVEPAGESTSTVPENLPSIKIDECSPIVDESSKPPSETQPIVTPVADESPILDEYVGHLLPSEVDTFELDGDIIYMSSGIYHYALITHHSSLYMWGKNIERQLGRENAKPDLVAPTKHHQMTSVKYVECGADFTMVITTDDELLTFGNNNMGQCGVENQSASSNGVGPAGKLIRFKSSKRVFRIPESSMYLHNAMNVRLLSSTIINFSNNLPICYLKNLPKFKRTCMIESTLSRSLRKDQHSSSMVINNNIRNASLSSIESSSSSLSTSSNDEREDDPPLAERANDYIHYCLFIFQGLYNVNADRAMMGSEYRIRSLMLNFNYIEAFKMALTSDGTSPAMSIKIFEYFTTDSNIIPMHTEDIKYFIYDVFLHFIANHQSADALKELEKYFMDNLEYYFMQLAFILYLCSSNNNNSTNIMERQLMEKFKHLYSAYDQQLNPYFDPNEIENIFKSISTGFHCALCQMILKFSDENFD